MSHIFDALQKAESERSGIDLTSLAAATDLLQAAESRAAVQRAADLAPENLTEPAVIDPEPAQPSETQPSFPAGLEFPSVAESARPALTPQVDQFSQFQTLRVLVPLQSRLVCVTDKESLAAEKFRFLAVRIRQLQQSRRLKTVLITSSVPQEGKSMVAANLACTLARRAQQRILLVEGDLRRPSLAKMFGLGRIPGICEWLQGECNATNSIYHLDGPGFWILPAGSTPRNPLEVMQSGTLSALMDQLRAWFDWIIIDSPPVLPLADTSVWMRLADGILLISRQGTTEKRQLQSSLEVLEKSKLIGALMNCSTNKVNSEYYYQYRTSAAPAPRGENHHSRK
jgi:capsular exopolysaccharide synthesis family protein